MTGSRLHRGRVYWISAFRSLCDNSVLRVIPRSPAAAGRRGISHCVENTQSQIPLPRLRDRNDSVGRVITQTLQALRVRLTGNPALCDDGGNVAARGDVKSGMARGD